MRNWINNFFKSRSQIEAKSSDSVRHIDFTKITTEIISKTERPKYEWAKSVINTWIGMGIRLNVGASLQEIEETESTLNFKFPEAFKELYQIANGFRDWDSTSEWMSVSPLDKILKDYKVLDDDDFIPFCDHSINLFWICFSRSEEGVISSGSPGELLALTFEEGINLINTGSRKLFGHKE